MGKKVICGVSTISKSYHKPSTNQTAIKAMARYCLSALATPADRAPAELIDGTVVEDAPVGAPILAPEPSATTDVTGWETWVALGTESGPTPISNMLPSVELKFVLAIDISLLAMSYTTYALRKNVSPRTAVLSPAGTIPKIHARAPSRKRRSPASKRSSSIITVIFGEEKVYVIFMLFPANLHGR